MQIHSFDEMEAMLWFGNFHFASWGTVDAEAQRVFLWWMCGEWFCNTEGNTRKVYLSSIDGYSQMHFFPIGDRKINI